MTYEARGADGKKLVSGSSTQVMYDYESGSTLGIPADVEAAIRGLDGPFDTAGRPSVDSD